MSYRFVQDRSFWSWFMATAALTGLLFAWELGAFKTLMPSLPRMEPTATEIWFTFALIALLSMNIGLAQWRRKNGSCPIGVRRATTIGGAVSAVTLLCPVCLLVPISLLGLSFSLAFLAPFLPLLRLITLVLLSVTLIMLWPRMNS